MVDWEGEGKVMPDFAKLEGKGGRGARHGDDLPQWAARQQKVFTNWINNKVSSPPIPVGNSAREPEEALQGVGGAVSSGGRRSLERGFLLWIELHPGSGMAG